jgi:hypothetical protein
MERWRGWFFGLAVEVEGMVVQGGWLASGLAYE